MVRPPKDPPGACEPNKCKGIGLLPSSKGDTTFVHEAKMSTNGIPDTICEIQDAPSSMAIPLVLIHDGGGTVFNYWTLGPLHRQMFGISDPAFDSGAEWRGWEGGLKQMAELYCNMIRKEIGKGKILLGGKYLVE